MAYEYKLAKNPYGAAPHFSLYIQVFKLPDAARPPRLKVVHTSRVYCLTRSVDILPCQEVDGGGALVRKSNSFGECKAVGGPVRVSWTPPHAYHKRCKRKSAHPTSCSCTLHIHQWILPLLAFPPTSFRTFSTALSHFIVAARN